MIAKTLENLNAVAVKNLSTINPFESISNNLKDLNTNFKESIDTLKLIANFFNNIGKFFKEASYWVKHPLEVMDAMQPWIIILLMVLILLKTIGFKTDKWLSLFFIIFVIVLVF